MNRQMTREEWLPSPSLAISGFICKMWGMPLCVRPLGPGVACVAGARRFQATRGCEVGSGPAKYHQAQVSPPPLLSASVCVSLICNSRNGRKSAGPRAGSTLRCFLGRQMARLRETQRLGRKRAMVTAPRPRPARPPRPFLSIRVSFPISAGPRVPAHVSNLYLTFLNLRHRCFSRNPQSLKFAPGDTPLSPAPCKMSGRSSSPCPKNIKSLAA